MDPRWLMRAKRWAQNPPSMAMVLMVLAIIVACIAIWWLEQGYGWPEALTPNDMRRLGR